MSSEGLTDAECEGGWHVTQAFYTGLVFSEPAVARIKADAIATARAEERAKYKPLVHAARTIALMLDHYAQESTR